MGKYFKFILFLYLKILLNGYLLVQNWHWKYQNNMWNLFKINNKDNNDVVLVSWLLALNEFHTILCIFHCRRLTVRTVWVFGICTTLFYVFTEQAYMRRVRTLSIFGFPVIVRNDLLIIKDSATDIWFFGIWCESLVEVIMQNFRLLILIETTCKAS